MSDDSIVFSLVPLFVLAVIAGGIFVWFLAGYGARHGGVGFFRSRRVRRHGAIATATIAGSRNVRLLRSGGSAQVVVYVTEYALDVQPTGRAPFRASVTLPLATDEQYDLAALGAVPVRIDADGTVVIDTAASKRAVAAQAARAKSEKDRAFADLLDKPPGT